LSRPQGSRLPPRPLGVVLLALLQIWHGLWYLLLSLFFLVVSAATASGSSAVSGLATLVALAFLVLGFYALWLARGYVKGYEWARRRGIGVALFAIFLVVVEVAIVKLQVFLPSSPFWTVVGNIIIIWYLRRAATKRYFASRTAARR
jgi:hypothetical protein